MAWILVAESEGRFAERIRDALAADGWQLEVVADADAARRADQARSHDVLIVAAELPGAADLIARWADRLIGGSLALVAESGGAAAVAARAHERLDKPFTDSDLRLAVRRLAASRRAAAAADAGERLTSKDLFGDVLAEMESEGVEIAPPAAPSAAPPVQSPPTARPASAASASVARDVDRALERTLSGLLPKEKTKTPPPTRRDALGIDEMLSRTLGGLEGTDKPRRSTAPAPRPAPEPMPVQAEATPPDALPVSTPPAAEPPVPPPPAEVTAPVETPSATPAFTAALDLPDVVLRDVTPAEAAVPPREPSVAASEPPALFEPTPTPMPAAREARRTSREIDLSELDRLVHPRPKERESTGEGFGTQKVQLPRGLGGPPASNEFGPYTLLERIAVGGMAELWKARMKGVEGFQKTVAIKKILPHLTDSSDFVTMFIDEAKLAAQLNHNNIIHIYDLGKQGDDYYIAMEFVDGRDLRSILNTAREKNQPMPIGLALLVAARIAAALDYAHRMKDFEGRPLGLVHRDVSPQNVLISFEGDIKLCDFGIVKAVSKASKTQMGALKGKLQYMSPEQAWGRPVDSRSDIFSLGSLLFEMLTGRRLFAGDSEMSVLDAVREGRIQAPRDLDPRLPLEANALVLHALAKDPGDRFTAAGEMQRELEAMISSLKPVPSAQDLAAWVRALFGVEPRTGAVPTSEFAPPSVTASATAAAPAAASAAAGTTAAPQPHTATSERDAALEVPASRSKLWLAAALIAALIAGGWFLFGRSSGSPEAEPQAPPSDPAPPEAVPEGGEPGGAEPSGEAVSDAPAAPAIDVAEAVNEEVRKREEELRRQYDAELERRQREVAAATPAAAEPEPAPAPTAPPAPAPTQPEPEPEPEPAPQPEVQPAATTPAAAPPSAQPVSPAPAPAAVATAPPSTTTAAPPVTTPPPAPRPTVKEGDLVQPGPGVRPPVLVSFDKPEYPPIARRMRIEGTVELSLLVDETGKVLDVRLDRGVSQNVGMNEAATSAARSARFTPATKDGVRVKMWYRLTIPFRL